MARLVIERKIAAVIVFISCLFYLLPMVAHGDEQADQARRTALKAFFDTQVCEACHGSTPEFNIRSARVSYDVSGHKNNGNAFYANGAGCQQCHTHEGFVEFVTKGKVDDKSYVKLPTPPGCFTCHDPHTNGNLSPRTVAPVKLIDGKQFNIGNGNLCASCHKTREEKTALVKDTPADQLPGHWGPHHGPQADMLIGTNGFEYPGKTYYSSVHATLTKNSCIECHMTYPAERFSFSSDMGGHSFSIVGEVHHQPKLNVIGCLGKCHAKVGQVIAVNPDTPSDQFWWHQTTAVYDIEAKADFDNDGKTEPLQSEIEGLLNLFVNNKGTGYLQRGELPMYKKDGSWNWTRSKQVRPAKQVAALYNYKYISEDRSRGIHNAPYTIQLLYDSIADLDPGFDTSKRNTYRPPEEYKPAQ